MVADKKDMEANRKDIVAKRKEMGANRKKIGANRKDMLVGWLVGFYGISTFAGYLTPNPFLCK